MIQTDKQRYYCSQVFMSFATEQGLETYRMLKKHLDERGIRIVTIALNADIDSDINIYHLARYVNLSQDGILSVDYDNRGVNRIVRSIVDIKVPDKVFFNQTTVRIMPSNVNATDGSTLCDDKEKTMINLKVFKQKSLQITGCKDIEDCHDVIGKLIKILKEGTVIERDGKERKIVFCNNPDEIGLKDIIIRLSVSCFDLGFKIDRRWLARILKNDHSLYSKDETIGYVKFKNDPNAKHSCVNIKYQYDERTTISIFVFHTGSVIITAAKSLQQIISAHDYAMKIITRYKEEIKVPILDPDIIKLIEKNYAKTFTS